MADIKSIEIEVGGRLLKFTMDEARELKNALESLLGKPSPDYVPYPVYPSGPSNPQPHWNEPYARPWVIPMYEPNTGTPLPNTTQIITCASQFN